MIMKVTFFEKNLSAEGTSLREFVSWSDMSDYLLRTRPHSDVVNMRRMNHHLFGECYEVKVDRDIVGWCNV